MCFPLHRETKADFLWSGVSALRAHIFKHGRRKKIPVWSLIFAFAILLSRDANKLISYLLLACQCVCMCVCEISSKRLLCLATCLLLMLFSKLLLSSWTVCTLCFEALLSLKWMCLSVVYVVTTSINGSSSATDLILLIHVTAGCVGDEDAGSDMQTTPGCKTDFFLFIFFK